jgi:hypothetical protein
METERLEQEGYDYRMQGARIWPTEKRLIGDERVIQLCGRTRQVLSPSLSFDEPNSGFSIRPTIWEST